MKSIFYFIFFIFFNLFTFLLALDCPDGWQALESSCYKVMGRFGNSQTFGWLKALRVCLGFGGNLVSITSEKEKEFVDGISFSTIRNNTTWIGRTSKTNALLILLPEINDFLQNLQ